MDLSKLDVVALADAGVTVELLNPDGSGELLKNDDGTVWTIQAAGADSKLFKGEIKSRVRQQMAKKGKKEDIDLDEAEKRGAELLAKCTLSWNGIIENGKEVKFSYAAAVDLYTRFPWMKEQVDSAISDRSQLFKA